MKRGDKQAYETELKRAAHQLGLPARGALERVIIQHCVGRVEQWIAAHGRPSTLSELLTQTTVCLGVKVAEIESDADLEALLSEIPPEREPILATLVTELDDDTDGIMIQRLKPEPWEPPFLAVINCRGWHAFRRYFSKWHEVAHLLIDGPQLRFAFRKTQVSELRRDPKEILVDRVAAELAFYTPIFQPVLLDHLARRSRLTFEAIDDIRTMAAPEASRQATILACIRNCPDAVCFIRGQIGYKRRDQRFLDSGQLQLPVGPAVQPVPKLRVIDAISSPTATERGIRIHNNMRVPPNSVVDQAFQDPLGEIHTGREQLQEWQTSSGGPIGEGVLEVEAVRYEDQVWAILYIVD